MRFDPAVADELFTAMIDIATHVLDDVESIVKRILLLVIVAE